MRTFITVFLLGLLSWQTLFMAGYMLYWKINQAYITEQYCSNKSKPKMHCNGKCHLAKKLQDIEEGRKENSGMPSEILKLKSVDPYIRQDHHLVLMTSDPETNSNQSIPPYLFALSTAHLKQVYQPPEFIG